MKLILTGGCSGKQVKSTRQLLSRLIDKNKIILYVPLTWPDPSNLDVFDIVLCTF